MDVAKVITWCIFGFFALVLLSVVSLFLEVAVSVLAAVFSAIMAIFGVFISLLCSKGGLILLGIGLFVYIMGRKDRKRPYYTYY